jgi:hypothetical protein
MSREATTELTEGTAIAQFDRIIDGLSHELSCLIDLRVLTSEEEAAFSAALEDLWALLARARRSTVIGASDEHELSRMVRLLRADLDLAYQRLCSAA